eukprot:TRINITY_DN5081_c0_g1_i1.p1 TRINITY_DN5081_c0_g1~~TRINITY_DN5081_c0_g1_i1.p1  ORF type:complete len:620 (-),score=184.85 TRINITY_DN5081_c0_g1_i1:198-2057(-)
MGDENECYQYPLHPNPDNSNNAFAMSVKLSSELFDLISLHSFTNLQAVFASNKGKILVDDKTFEFSCTPEKTSVDVLHFVGEEGSFREIGQVKRKYLLSSQKLTSVAAENLIMSAEKAENDRKKKKALVLDDVNNKLKPSIKKVDTTSLSSQRESSKPVLPIPKNPLPAPTKPILPLPNGTLTLPKKIPSNLTVNNSTPNAQTQTAPSTTSANSATTPKPRAPKPPKQTKPTSFVIPSGLSGGELKDAIIHSLALKEINTTRFPKEATQYLSKVATVKPPGLFHLKDLFYREVRVDAWEHYSPEEREKVRSRVAAALARLPPLPAQQPLSDTPHIINNNTTNANSNSNNNNNLSNSPLNISENIITPQNPVSVTNTNNSSNNTQQNYISGVNLPIPKKRKTEDPTKSTISEKLLDTSILQPQKPPLKPPTQPITNTHNINNNNNNNSFTNHNSHPHPSHHSHSSTKENGTVLMNGHSKTTSKIVQNNESLTPPNSPPRAPSNHTHKENGKENGFHFEPITDSAMYEKCSQEFTIKYGRYTHLHKFLEENSEHFKRIGEKWEHTTDPREKERLGLEIAKYFNERQGQVSTLTDEYHSLHKQLRALKQRMNDYLGKRKRKL